MVVMSRAAGSTNKSVCPYGCGQLLSGFDTEEHLAKHRSQLDAALRLRVKIPNEELAFCPYSACHVVPKVELLVHTAACPSKQRYLMIQSVLKWNQVDVEADERPSSLPTSFVPRKTSTITTKSGRYSSGDSGRGESASSTPRSLQSVTPTSICSAVNISSLDINEDEYASYGESFTSYKLPTDTPQGSASHSGASTNAAGNAPAASLGGARSRYLRPRNGPMARKKKEPV